MTSAAAVPSAMPVKAKPPISQCRSAIAIVGFRMWIDGKVDFARPVNQMTAGVALVIAIADLHWEVGGFAFTGIALGTVAALAIFHGMRGIGRLTGTDVESVHRPAG